MTRLRHPSHLGLLLLLLALGAAAEEGPSPELERRLAEARAAERERLGDVTPILQVDDSEYLADLAAVRGHAAGILKRIGDGDLDAAFELLAAKCAVPDEELAQQAERTKTQIRHFEPRFGLPVGYELIDEHRRGDSLILIRGISKYDHTALQWQFLYYRARERWILVNFLWNDQLGNLFP